jgi:Undecaprenyl-phosphate glucose phosphotransferase
MLYRYSDVLRTLMGMADAGLVACAWLLAYWLRFHSNLPVPHGVPESSAYVEALLVILPIWFVLFRTYGLYEPRRTDSLLVETGLVLRATAAGVMLLVAVSFFARSYYYSRGVVAIFSMLCPAMIISLRLSVRGALRGLRRKGYNLRYVIVVGDGQLAEEVIDRIHAVPGAGIRVRGVIAQGGVGLRTVRGVPVIGSFSGLKGLLHEPQDRVDQVILALPREEASQLEKVLADLDDEMVNVVLVPDLLHVTRLHSSAEILDGLAVINLRESPLVGWAAVGKRCFDVCVSGAGLVLAAPWMALIGLGVLVTSGRPVLFSQKRMGLDGHVFKMYKFRSMIRGAEKLSGPVWTGEDDPRRTRFGAFMRTFDLDELPQLWNVLKGDMSLVGPRPERPFFIESFRKEVPGYMLRHKVKSGMTGWAQVHGLRGSTSIHDRVEHDLYYIQNWSPGLDIRILLMTLWNGLFRRRREQPE